jgi:hypothetical protein
VSQGESQANIIDNLERSQNIHQIGNWLKVKNGSDFIRSNVNPRNISTAPII